MADKKIFVLIFSLIALIIASSLFNGIYWAERERVSAATRSVVGLPSIAFGNLSPAARNPGLELFCSSLYDLPGGYCYYFTPGVSYINYSEVAWS